MYAENKMNVSNSNKHIKFVYISSSSIKKAINLWRHFCRCEFNIFFWMFWKRQSSIFLIKTIVSGTNEFFVISLQTFPQLYIWYGVHSLKSGNFLEFFVKTFKFFLDSSGMSLVKTSWGHQNSIGNISILGQRTSLDMDGTLDFDPFNLHQPNHSL